MKFPSHEERVNGSRLIRAIEVDDTEMINQCLQKRLDLNGSLDFSGVTISSSYLQYAIECKSTSGVILLLKHGADPNLGQRCSPLQMATGAVEGISPSFEIAEILVSYGATHGGWYNYGLSLQEKEKLDKARKEYINDGLEVINHIKSHLDPKSRLKSEDFLHKIEYAKADLYASLEPQDQLIVDRDIQMIQEKVFSNPGMIKKSSKWMKSFFVYIESDPCKEVHLLFMHTTNIMNSHAKLEELKTEENNEIDVSGEVTDYNPFC